MNTNYILPLTIVIAGVLIAGAVFFVGKSQAPAANNGTGTQTSAVPAFDATKDHILGNPNAPVKVVEYMDLECPHCKIFNTTMHQVLSHYGTTGQVAWVQRPFPLGQVHSRAPKEAEAAECAADQGGNTAYFAYTDKLFETTQSDNSLDPAQLPVIAKAVGLNVDTFNSCLSSGKFTQKVTDSYAEAIAAAQSANLQAGTPLTFIMVGTDAVGLEGAQPYDSMKSAIDAVIAQIPGNATSTASTTTQ